MRNAETLIRSLNTLPVSVAVTGKDGRIAAVNATWKQFGIANGLLLKDFGIGSKYLDYCTDADPETKKPADDLRALFGGRIDLVTMLYPCHSASRPRWFFMIGMPLDPDEHAGTVLFHVDLSMVAPVLHELTARHRAKADNADHPFAPEAALVSGAMEGAVAGALSTQFTGMIAAAVAGDSRRRGGNPDIPDPAEVLSRRQLEVFRLLGNGRTNAEIAATLVRSPYTVKLHVSAILDRLNLKNRTQAALLASKLFGRGTARDAWTLPAPTAARGVRKRA